METMTIGEIIEALLQIGKERGSDTPVMMLPVENDEPLNITSVNLGFDEEGHPVANFTTDEYSHITIARRNDVYAKN